MSPAEYRDFFQQSFANHVRELMEEEGLTEQLAEQEIRKELSQMLPEGQTTPGNAFLTVCREDGATVGWMWTVTEDQADGRECFLCDFLIFEAERRNGYGHQSLHCMAEQARKEGCDRCVLFVKNSNPAAIELYQKAGFVLLEEHTYGMFMAKQLAGSQDTR